MKAFYVSNFTKHPKLILEDNQTIDLIDDIKDSTVVLSSIDTVIGTYNLDEIIVSNLRDKELLEYLNTAYKFNNIRELKITLQE